jgi:hypothetical protein
MANLLEPAGDWGERIANLPAMGLLPDYHLPGEQEGLLSAQAHPERPCLCQQQCRLSSHPLQADLQSVPDQAIQTVRAKTGSLLF